MLFLSIIAPILRVDAVWKSYRGTFENLGHANNASIVGPGSDAYLLWQFTGESSAGFVGSPAITSDNIAIIGDLEGRVYGLDISTGTVLWTTTGIGEYLSASPTLNADESSVYVSGYVPSTNSAIDATINPRTGEVKVQYLIPDMPPGGGTSAFSSFALYTPPDSDDLLAICAYGDKIYAFHTTDYYDPATGDHYHPGWLKWNNTEIFNSSYASVISHDINIQSSVAIGGENLYFGTPAGDVIALECATGAELWRVYVGGYIGSSPIVDEKRNRLYITGRRGLFLLTTESSVASTDRLLAEFRASTTTSSPALSTDSKTLYFATDQDPVLYAVDIEDTWQVRRQLVNMARVKWQYTLKAPVQLSSPTVDALGSVYVGDSGGTVYAINSTGGLIWSHDDPSGSPVYGSASMGGNYSLLIGSQSGLYAFYAKPQAEAVADPPLKPKGTTDFPDGGLWAIFGLLLCICFLMVVWTILWLGKRKRKEEAQKRMEQETVVLEARHRGSSAVSGLRSVYSSQSTSTSEMLDPEELAQDRCAAEWRSSTANSAKKRQRTYTHESSIDLGSHEFTSTGKFSRPRMQSTNTNRTNRSSSMYSFNFGIGAGGGGGAGGRHVSFNAINTVRESSEDTSNSSSGSERGIVHGLFVMLGLREASSTEESKKQPRELATVVQPTSEMRLSQEVIEIRVSTPSYTPEPSPSKAVSLLYGKSRLGARDSLDLYHRREERGRTITSESLDSAAGTMMFSRKASGLEEGASSTKEPQECFEAATPDTAPGLPSGLALRTQHRRSRLRRALWEKQMMDDLGDSFSVTDSTLRADNASHAHLEITASVRQKQQQRKSQRYDSPSSPRPPTPPEVSTEEGSDDGDDDEEQYWQNKPKPKGRSDRETAILYAAAAAGGKEAVHRTSGTDDSGGSGASNADMVEKSDIVRSASMSYPPAEEALLCLSMASMRSSAFARADEIPMTPVSNLSVPTLHELACLDQGLLLPPIAASQDQDCVVSGDALPGASPQRLTSRHPRQQLESLQKVLQTKVLSLELPTPSSSISSWPSLRDPMMSEPQYLPPPAPQYTGPPSVSTVRTEREVESPEERVGVSVSVLPRSTSGANLGEGDVTRRSEGTQETQETEYFG